MRDLRDSASEEAVLKEKLKAFQTAAGPDAKLVNAAHARRALRERERKTIEALHGDLYKVRLDIKAVVDAATHRLDMRIDADIAGGVNKDTFARVGEELRQLSTLLESTTTKISQQVFAADGVVTEQQKLLADRHAAQEAEYRALIAKTQEETGRAAERAQLQQRYAEVTTARKELELREKERRERESQRQDLLGKLSGLRDRRYELRKKVADDLSEALQPTIKVSITQAENSEAYRALLAEALKGQSMKYGTVIDHIVGAKNVTPADLAVIAQRKDVDRLATRTGLDEERAKRVVDALGDLEMLYRIETVELEDMPRIQLLDGKTPKDTGELRWCPGRIHRRHRRQALDDHHGPAGGAADRHHDRRAIRAANAELVLPGDEPGRRTRARRGGVGPQERPRCQD